MKMRAEEMGHEPLALADEVTEQPANVRFWPLADMTLCAAHVRYWG
jgi:hypothetical protein